MRKTIIFVTIIFAIFMIMSLNLDNDNEDCNRRDYCRNI